MNPMACLLSVLPDLPTIEAEASAKFPDSPERAAAHAHGQLSGYYQAARLALIELMGPPDDDEEDDEDDDSTVDYGYVPAAEAVVYDDPEAADIGREPNRYTDTTRHDLRRAMP